MKNFPFSPLLYFHSLFLLIFFENAIHLTTLLTTNSKIDFIFSLFSFFFSIILLPRHPLEASLFLEIVPVMPHWCVYGFIRLLSSLFVLFCFPSFFFWLSVTYSLHELNVTSIVSNLWRKPNCIY